MRFQQILYTRAYDFHYNYIDTYSWETIKKYKNLQKTRKIKIMWNIYASGRRWVDSCWRVEKINGRNEWELKANKPKKKKTKEETEVNVKKKTQKLNRRSRIWKIAGNFELNWTIGSGNIWQKKIFPHTEVANT